MDLTLTDEQRLIKQTARELLSSRSPVSQAGAMADDPTGYSPELWKEMVELGWTGLALPEEHGGLGMGFLELCLVVEELGAFCVPSPFVPTVVWCGMALARHAGPEVREPYLVSLVHGERLMTYGHTGPDGRWGAEGTGMTYARSGDGYRLDGEVWFVPYAQAADDLLLAARSEDGELAVLMVDGTSNGVWRTELETVGTERTYRVQCDGVQVSPDRLLGGREVVDTITAHGTAAACAEMVGGAQSVLDMTVAYATDRRQFGRPIGSFQAIQHHCADMASDVLGARFMAYEAIWRLSEGLDATQEVSLAKAWCSEAYARVCALGHQVHGAIGFTQEYELHHFLRHAMARELTFGDADHHLEKVARSIGL